MNKNSFIKNLRRLVKTHQKSTVTYKHLRQLLSQCKTDVRHDSDNNQNVILDRRTTKSKLLRLTLRRVLSFVIVSVLILFIARVAYNKNAFLLYVSNEECILGLTDFFTEITRPLVDCSKCAGMRRVHQVDHISEPEFSKNYAYTNVPLLVKGAAKNWTALQVFSFHYFQKLYKNTPGSFAKVEENCQFFHYKTDFADLEEVFNMSDARANSNDGEKPWYIGWCDEGTPTSRQLDKHYTRPYFLPPLIPNEHSSGSDWIFMGWQGQGAFIHIDMVSAPSWQAQIRGSKTWMLYPSVECEDVCSPFNATLEAGDILTVDTNKWFHSTYIHPGDISISIGNEY